MTGLRDWARWLWECLTGWLHPMPASQIEPCLWMGPAPEGVASLPPGVRAVLNVCERDDVPAIHTATDYSWAPILDGPFPGIPWLSVHTDWVCARVKAGIPVLVHCTEGQSRSGMVTVAALMKLHGWASATALAFAHGKRSVCDPNPAFKAGLLQYEAFLRDNPGLP